MAECKTVTVTGPSVDTPSAASFDVETDVNEANVKVEWENPNDFDISADSELSVDGEKEVEEISIDGGGTESVEYTVEFDIPADEEESKEFCVECINVSEK